MPIPRTDGLFGKFKAISSLASLALAGCATTGAPPRLAGSIWNVVQINDQRATGSISFDVDSFAGEFGCNQIQGAYRLEDNVFRSGLINKTDMACEPLEPGMSPSLMELERAALAVLSGEPRSIWDGKDGLVLRSAAGEIVLVRSRPANGGFGRKRTLAHGTKGGGAC